MMKGRMKDAQPDSLWYDGVGVSQQVCRVARGESLCIKTEELRAGNGHPKEKRSVSCMQVV